MTSNIPPVAPYGQTTQGEGCCRPLGSKFIHTTWFYAYTTVAFKSSSTKASSGLPERNFGVANKSYMPWNRMLGATEVRRAEKEKEKEERDGERSCQK